MIRAKDIHKTYRSEFLRRKTLALRGVTLHVREGEIYGFVGVNGAGKSTFIKIALGMVKATKGGISVLGEAPGFAPARSKIGYLPEQTLFPHYWTARDFLADAARVRGIEGAEAEKRINELLERVSLTQHAERKIVEFSKGMQQRLGIAVCLLARPKILILDEPMSGLDPLGRREVRNILLGEKKRGVTVFFSSHIFTDVEAVADRIGVLHKGKLIKETTASDMFLAGVKSGVEISLPPLDEETMAQLKPFAAETLTDGKGSALKTDSLEQYEKLMDALMKKRIAPRRVDLVKPSLDDLFAEAIAEAEQ